MGEREVRERYARMEARADVVDRLVDEAKPTRMIGAGIVGGTPPWFTLLLVPMFGPVDIFNPAELTVPVLHAVMPRARTEMPGRFLNARPTYQGLECEALGRRWRLPVPAPASSLRSVRVPPRGQ